MCDGVKVKRAGVRHRLSPVKEPAPLSVSLKCIHEIVPDYRTRTHTPLHIDVAAHDAGIAGDIGGRVGNVPGTSSAPALMAGDGVGIQRRLQLEVVVRRVDGELRVFDLMLPEPVESGPLSVAKSEYSTTGSGVVFVASPSISIPLPLPQTILFAASITGASFPFPCP